MIQFVIGMFIAALNPQESRIEWRTNLPETLEHAAKTRKSVVVIFKANWCVSCQRFWSGTLADPKVQAQAGRFLWVQVDIDRDVKTARKHHVTIIPRFDLIDPDGITRVSVTGNLDPGGFCKRLDLFAEDLDANPTRPPDTPANSINADDHTHLMPSPDGYRGLSICFANVGYGILNLPSQSPFQALRVGFKPRTPSTITKGVVEAQVSETWVNLWAFDRGKYLIDAEMLRSSLSLGYGLSNTLEVAVELVDKSRFGGEMDHLIQGFHDTFHISQGGRDEFPKDDFDVSIMPEISLSNRDRGSFSQESLISLQHNVTCGTETFPALAYSLSLRTDRDPADDRTGGSPVDLSISGSAAKSFGDFYGYAGLGLAWFGKERFRGVEMKTTQASLMLALEWRYTADASLLLQYLGSENILHGPGPFGKPSSELTLGWKMELEPGLVLEAGLIENFVLMDNSPDLGFHAGFTWRF